MRSDDAVSGGLSRVKGNGVDPHRESKKHVMPFLRRLARQGVCARRQQGDARAAGGWRIVPETRGALAPRSASKGGADGTGVISREVISRRVAGSAAVWSGELVKQALSAGLVVLNGEEIRLSSGGAAFLRRALAAPDDAYAAQHQHRVTRTLDDRSQVTVNECESPLGWLRNRKDRKTGKALISRNQFDAGERLRQDFMKAHMSARITADWSGKTMSGRSRRSGAGDRADLNDVAIAAKDRFYQALAAVGEELSDVLVWVCCDGRGLSDIERAAGWPQRSGKLMLQTALKALSRHYGLEPSRLSSVSHRPNVQQWGVTGYRPRIDGDDSQAES